MHSRDKKYCNVAGKEAKNKKDRYSNIRITESRFESTFCCANPKFLAIVTQTSGGGDFLVIPVEKKGEVDPNMARVKGHKKAVLDIAFCPHNDNLIASGSEDCTVKVWEIPDGGLTQDLSEEDCVADLVKHRDRVGSISWHPSAYGVLMSTGPDRRVIVWNVVTSEILTELDIHPDAIFSAVWNYDGSKILTTCKDKMLRVYDPRSGQKLIEGKTHNQATKRALFLKDGRIFTVGMNSSVQRQYALWDADNLENPLVIEDLDSSSGVLFPFYDEDTNMIYLCGKGDSNIHYFEYTPSIPPYIHYINSFQTMEPQRGIARMPKRGLNVTGWDDTRFTDAYEIFRFYKLLNTGVCEVISMNVLRKTEQFPDELYPNTAAEHAALTAGSWYSGYDMDPMLMSMKDVFTLQTSQRLSNNKNKVQTAPTVTAPSMARNNGLAPANPAINSNKPAPSVEESKPFSERLATFKNLETANGHSFKLKQVPNVMHSAPTTTKTDNLIVPTQIVEKSIVIEKESVIEKPQVIEKIQVVEKPHPVKENTQAANKGYCAVQ